jgi:plastocyanin
VTGRRGPALVGLWAATVAAAGGAGMGVFRRGATKPATHTVLIDATSYQPAWLAVHRGDTVVWVNRDLIPHTATATSKAFDSKVLAAGASWRLTVTSTGTTDYRCLFHPTMAGRIEAD